MIRIGVCDKDVAIVDTVEDYLKTRNCWYDLKNFKSINAICQFLEKDELDLLFVGAESEEEGRAIYCLGECVPAIKIVLMMENHSDRFQIEDTTLFYAVTREKLGMELPEIMDKYLIKERYFKKEHLVITNKGRQIVMDIRDVMYLERDKRISTVVCLSGENEATTMDFAALQEAIGRDDFVRCHNSYVVNLNYVKELRRNEFVLKNGKSIPISRRYLDEVRRRFKRWADSVW